MFFAILMSDGALTALPPKKRLPVKQGMMMSENGESGETSTPDMALNKTQCHPSQERKDTPSDRAVAVFACFRVQLRCFSCKNSHGYSG